LADTEPFNSKKSYPSSMPPFYYQDEELTLKELILKIIDFSKELWKFKWWVIVISILGACVMLGRTHFKTTTYTAGMTFMVDQQESNNARKAISTFGDIIVLGVENNKITELARSSRIIHPVLLSEVKLEGKTDFIANHIIDLYNLQDRWSKEKNIEKYKEITLTDFKFVESIIDSLTIREKRALNIVHEIAAGNNFSGTKGLMNISYDQDIEMFRLNINCVDEDFSIILMEQIFEGLKRFYTEGTIGKQEESLILWQTRSDSLEKVYNSLESRLSYAKDRSRGLISESGNINLVNLARQRNKARGEFEAALDNLRVSKQSLVKSKVDFIVVDRTFFPIADSASKIKALIIGGLTGLLLSMFYVIGRKIIVEALMDE